MAFSIPSSLLQVMIDSYMKFIKFLLLYRYSSSTKCCLNIQCETWMFDDQDLDFLSNMLTVCILMDFPIHSDTISMGRLPIVYFVGSQLEFSKLRCISVTEGCFNFSKQCRP